MRRQETAVPQLKKKILKRKWPNNVRGDDFALEFLYLEKLEINLPFPSLTQEMKKN